AAPVPLAIRKLIKQEIGHFVEDGVLVKVDYSDYATPVVPVMKLRLYADFKIRYKNSKLNVNADEFSRFPVTVRTRMRVTLKEYDIFRISQIQSLPITVDELEKETALDAGFASFLDELSVVHKKSASYHSPTNDQVERYVQTIKSKRKRLQADKSNLNKIPMQCRIPKHPTTKMSLSVMIFNYPVKTICTLMLPKSQRLEYTVNDMIQVPRNTFEFIPESKSKLDDGET
ncbi:hypothetical protein ILUMI_19122, partial [Ignelater luminosus]